MNINHSKHKNYEQLNGKLPNRSREESKYRPNSWKDNNQFTKSLPMANPEQNEELNEEFKEDFNKELNEELHEYKSSEKMYDDKPSISR